MTYKLTHTNTITRLSDGASIPQDTGNTDYQQYLDWIIAGGIPEPADPLPPPPAKQFTSLEFLDLFTQEEELAIASAAMAVPQMKLWYDRMLAASFITLADPRTEAGLEALVGAKLLSPDRKEEIISRMQ